MGSCISANRPSESKSKPCDDIDRGKAHVGKNICDQIFQEMEEEAENKSMEEAEVRNLLVYDDNRAKSLEKSQLPLPSDEQRR